MSAVMEAPVKKTVRHLVEPRMHQAEVVRRDWVVDAEVGTTLDEIQSTEYWAHVAPQFTIFDTIEVRMETGDWIAKLVVVDIGRNWTKVHLLHHYDLTKTVKVAAPADRYRIEYKGSHRKHSIIRQSDNEVIKDGFTRMDEAVSWLKNHEQTIDLT